MLWKRKNRAHEIAPQIRVTAVSGRFGKCAAANSTAARPTVPPSLPNSCVSRRHEQIVHQELLVERPQDVAGNVFEVALIQRMQRADLPRDQHAHDRKDDRCRENPERPRQPATANAQSVQAAFRTRTPRQHDRQRHDQRYRRKNALRKFRHPEDKQNQPVAENQLQEIASGTRLRAGRHGREYGTAFLAPPPRTPESLPERSRGRLSPQESQRLTTDDRRPKTGDPFPYTSNSGVASSKLRV